MRGNLGETGRNAMYALRMSGEETARLLKEYDALVGLIHVVRGLLVADVGVEGSKTYVDHREIVAMIDGTLRDLEEE